MDGLMTAAQMESDVVVSAVVGAIGLKPLVAAIRSRRTVALANKEALVVAGDLVMKEARRHGATILPVDSEHSAIFQCLKDESHDEVNKILLTASGGPFYRSKKSSAAITVTDALAHPTWMMGKKITIDSATLMNKGLEAIEAHHLFNVPLDRIEIVIHPQSIIHSMVEYVDGSVIAQMSLPDMRLPIQYAITYPARKPAPVQRLDLLQGVTLQFDRPDFKRFPCLGLALEAGLTGGTMPVVMNAANETAVNLFLNEKISFNDIPRIIERVMHSYSAKKNPDLDEIIAVDTEARLKAEEIVLGNVSYRNGRTSKRKS
jgi:1-deoxy-D-xylulose-5-phosphate reductoisomerase